MKNQTRKSVLLILFAFVFVLEATVGQKAASKNLLQLQQDFLDMKQGMLIEFNLPTYSQQHWIDPNTSVNVFNPTKLDCNQWADAAKSARMGYAILTAKHHNGFCIWNTKTTDYNVMKSPLKRDVVKEFSDAFRKKGIKVFLYYSILDIKHNIRAGWTDKEKVYFIESQLTELLTNYGEIGGLYLDGWDAPWSRISYDDISFEQIYKHIKSLQPNCLVITNNGGKYSESELFYSDILTCNNTLSRINSSRNSIPAHIILPLNRDWFWKQGYDTLPVMKGQEIANKIVTPINQSLCNATLNITPNPDGLIDQNMITELKELGRMNKNAESSPKLNIVKEPIISTNLAKHQKMNSSWSQNWLHSDLANDGNYQTAWRPNQTSKTAFLEINFDVPTTINCIGFVETDNLSFKIKPLQNALDSYKIEYWDTNVWKSIEITNTANKVRIHKFNSISTTKVRILIESFKPGFGISEILIYNQLN
ncbi:MAG: alpha-L-fucosidase [Paludibacter sp.]|nr:alpha-L-fucosidase [Paludibacter sp.]